MDKENELILSMNPNIDTDIVSQFMALEASLPPSERTRPGAQYFLSLPFERNLSHSISNSENNANQAYALQKKAV